MMPLKITTSFELFMLGFSHNHAYAVNKNTCYERAHPLPISRMRDNRAGREKTNVPRTAIPNHLLPPQTVNQSITRGTKLNLQARL
ncbi:hypothetical protein ANRL1_04250 [Anaerolineae bacterium]|nr:hypothetical protein ANRL1_04250 [Anaerolineae bacterium]